MFTALAELLRGSNPMKAYKLFSKNQFAMRCSLVPVRDLNISSLREVLQCVCEGNCRSTTQEGEKSLNFNLSFPFSY